MLKMTKDSFKWLKTTKNSLKYLILFYFLVFIFIIFRFYFYKIIKQPYYIDTIVQLNQVVCNHIVIARLR